MGRYVLQGGQWVLPSNYGESESDDLALPPHTMLNSPFSHRPLYTSYYSYPKRNRRNWLWPGKYREGCVCRGEGKGGGGGGGSKVYVIMVDGWK